MEERSRKPRISIEVDAEMRTRLKVAAARREITVRRYVLAALERALAAEDDADWSRLSEPSFAR